MEHKMRKEINKFKDFLNENSEENLNISDVMNSKIMDWIDIQIEKPKLFQDIVVLTSVGRIEGFYLKKNIVQTKRGLFNFTKWKPKE
jgi:hypothetical protein